jgi:hypothetical protein
MAVCIARRPALSTRDFGPVPPGISAIGAELQSTGHRLNCVRLAVVALLRRFEHGRWFELGVFLLGPGERAARLVPQSGATTFDQSK